MSAPPIRVFNTLTRRKEELVPLRARELGIYVCGPTVYDYVHIGNARTFTAFDVIVRYLRYRGFRVTYVRNFTDIDDKIIDAARASGEDAIALAARFVEEFRKDARAVRMLEPDFSPKEASLAKASRYCGLFCAERSRPRTANGRWSG